MTDLWDLYCKTLAQTKVIYRDPQGIEIPMPEEIKPEVLSIAMQECSSGTTPLVLGCNDARGNFGPPLNFHSLQWRNNLRVDFPVGKVTYDGPDGRRDYFDFRTVLEAIVGFWAFIHRPNYPDIDHHIHDGEDFVNYLLPIFCQFGFTEEFKKIMGQDYADVVLKVHRPTAVAQLKRYGWKEPFKNYKRWPVNFYKSIEGYYIDEGVIHGPNVKYFWVCNYDHFLRPRTKGIIYHEPDARGTGRELEGLGIVNEWNKKGSGRSAHVLFLEDGTILQCVNLLYPAYHCYGYQWDTVGLEFAYLGPFYPSREILGRFFRWKGLPWEQSVAKKDCVLIKGMYWPAEGFTVPQIKSGKIVTALLRKEFGPLYGKGHSEVDPEHRVDPGPLFPIEEMRELLK